jgi:hypothetical protein
MGGGPTPLPPVLLRWVLLPWLFGHFVELAPFVFYSRYRPSSNRHLCGFHNRSASRAKVGFFLLHTDNDFPYVGNIWAAQSVNVGCASSALLCSYDESKARWRKGHDEHYNPRMSRDKVPWKQRKEVHASSSHLCSYQTAFLGSRRTEASHAKSPNVNLLVSSGVLYQLTRIAEPLSWGATAESGAIGAACEEPETTEKTAPTTAIARAKRFLIIVFSMAPSCRYSYTEAKAHFRQGGANIPKASRESISASDHAVRMINHTAWPRWNDVE